MLSKGGGGGGAWFCVSIRGSKKEVPEASLDWPPVAPLCLLHPKVYPIFPNRVSSHTREVGAVEGRFIKSSLAQTRKDQRLLDCNVYAEG